MSSEIEVSCDKDGFFRCVMCPRRFVTKFGFENHSSNQHQKQVGTKLYKLPTENDQNCILACHLSSQSKTDLQSSAYETQVFHKWRDLKLRSQEGWRIVSTDSSLQKEKLVRFKGD